MGVFSTRIDHTGEKYNRLTVIKFIKSVNKEIYWDCMCDCGTKTMVTSKNLRHTKSCGCYRHIQNLGESNGSWKGDKVGYTALHNFVKRHKEKSTHCDICHNDIKLELANKDGRYLRDLNNWLWLCRSCHRKHDKKKPPTFKGMKHTEETKLKMSESAKKRFNLI